MSSIRFRFKSALEFDQVRFDGLQLSVADLKAKIMAQKKLGASSEKKLGEFTLEIMDAQTKKVYTDDKEMIPRNTSVIVKRIPRLVQPKAPKTYQKDSSLPQAEVRAITKDELGKTADLARADASEEDKVAAMIIQAGIEYDPSSYAQYRGPKGRSMTGPPPPNYVCHRCGQRGHWIRMCPTNADPSFNPIRLSHSTNIPAQHLIHVSSTNVPCTMVDRSGRLVIRRVDLMAASDSGGKSKISDPAVEKEIEVPDELKCGICKELVKDAVVIPCCGSSFCDECIRDHLLENEFQCFACKEVDVSPEALVPNKTVRMSVRNFLNQVEERKSIAVARGYQPLSIMPPSSSHLAQSSTFQPLAIEAPPRKPATAAEKALAPKAATVVNHVRSDKAQLVSEARAEEKVSSGGPLTNEMPKKTAAALNKESSQETVRSVASKPAAISREGSKSVGSTMSKAVGISRGGSQESVKSTCKESSQQSVNLIPTSRSVSRESVEAISREGSSQSSVVRSGAMGLEALPDGVVGSVSTVTSGEGSQGSSRSVSTVTRSSDSQESAGSVSVVTAISREGSRESVKSSPLHTARNVSPTKMNSTPPLSEDISDSALAAMTSALVPAAITGPITVSPSSAVGTVSRRRPPPPSTSVLAALPPPPLPPPSRPILPAVPPPNPMALLAAATAAGRLVPPAPQTILPPPLPPAILPVAPPQPPPTGLFVQPPPPPQPPPSNPLTNIQPPLDAMSLVRLTELLAAAETPDENGPGDRVASPPLSMKQFYHQQKLLLKKSKRSRHSFSPSPSVSSSSYSDSFDSHSYSSSSLSRSPSWSPFYYYGSRSRSRSPYLKAKGSSSGRRSRQSRQVESPSRHRRHLVDRSERTRKRKRDREDLEVVDRHRSRKKRKHHRHHRHWQGEEGDEDEVSSRTGSSQRLLSPPGPTKPAAGRKSRSRSNHRHHERRHSHSSRSKRRRAKRRKKADEERAASCSPSEMEEEEWSDDNVRTAKPSATNKTMADTYNSSSPGSSDEGENPYPTTVATAVVPSAMVEGLVGSASATLADSQTSSSSSGGGGKVGREEAASHNAEVDRTLDNNKVDGESPREHRSKWEDSEDDEAAEEGEATTTTTGPLVRQEDNEGSQDMDETHATEEDRDGGHEEEDNEDDRILASTVHKVDTTKKHAANSLATASTTTDVALPTAPHGNRKSRHKEHKHKSADRHRHRYHQQRHEQQQQQQRPPSKEQHSRTKHERRKKHHHHRDQQQKLALPSSSERATRNAKRSLSVKKKKRKHSHRE